MMVTGLSRLCERKRTTNRQLTEQIQFYDKIKMFPLMFGDFQTYVI